MQGKNIQLASEERMFLQASSSAWFLFGLFLGDKLGILTRLPKSSLEAICVQTLSEETKLNRRYLDEWLNVVSCAIHRCSHPGCERVWLSPSWHQVLTEEGGKKHLMELASVFVRAVQGEERLSNFFFF